MIENQHNEVTLICDGCEDDLGEMFPRDDFKGMTAFARQIGWKIAPTDDGGWTHLCPDCKRAT